MHNKLTTTFLAFAALALPTIAMADVSNNVTLNSGQHYSFDTGTTSTSGGDIDFTGTSITAQGSATFYTLGDLGASGYNALAQSEITSFPLTLFSTTPVSGSTFIATDLFLVYTNGGHYVKVLVNSVSGSSLSMQYTAYGVTGNSNTPTITAVLDAGSYTANIAEGSIFVVKGSGLSAAGLVQPPFPLPTSSSGVSIAFTPANGGTPIAAFIDYLYNESGVNQLAAVLPSSTPVGTYNVTVTNSGSTSSPFTVQVVKQKPGLLTADEAGDGLAVAVNYTGSQENLDRYTTGTVGAFTSSPAHPGDTEVAYSVGMGPDPGPDNVASPGYNFLTNGATVLVSVGGMQITPSFAGRVQGGTGYEQINFVLPPNVTTGCAVPFSISVNGVASQAVYLSIAQAGANACVEPGYTTSQLQAFDTGGVVDNGGFSLITENSSALGQTFDFSSFGGEFSQFSGFELASVPANIQTILANSGCTVLQLTPVQTGLVPGTAVTNLDAGKLTLTGPSGSNLNSTAVPETGNIYELSISGAGSTINGNIVAGKYTLNGAGGTGVGAFSASLTIPSPLTITGSLPTTVNRSAGLTINWTGGNSTDLVEVSGVAELETNGNITSGAEFVCITTAGAGGYTVTSSVLNQLPAISASQISSSAGIGDLSVLWIVGQSGNGQFSAPLVAGGTVNGVLGAETITSTTAAYQ